MNMTHRLVMSVCVCAYVRVRADGYMLDRMYACMCVLYMGVYEILIVHEKVSLFQKCL